MSAPFRFPRFFVTTPSPCPYLTGKTERKVFTELTGQHAGELNDALGRIGFRRSQGVAYRPSCIDCAACVSVRVIAGEFQPSATQRRVLRRNVDLEVTACKPWTTQEQYALLRRYLKSRHPGGGMVDMDESDFADMVEQSPVKTYVVEYREPSLDGRPGLGTYIILDHIIRAGRAGLPYVFLGYWVESSRRMSYKAKFRPLERLGPDGWRRFEPDQKELPLSV